MRGGPLGFEHGAQLLIFGAEAVELLGGDVAALNANMSTIRMPPLATAARFGGRGERQNARSVGLLESVAEVAEAQGNRLQEDCG